MRSQPRWRREQVDALASQFSLNRSTILSLRRHHIKQNNMYLPEEALKLGTREEKLRAANAFESCVARYLDIIGVGYVDEEEQRRR